MKKSAIDSLLAMILAISRSSPVDPLPHHMWTPLGVTITNTSFEFNEDALSGTYYNHLIKLIHVFANSFGLIL